MLSKSLFLPLSHIHLTAGYAANYALPDPKTGDRVVLLCLVLAGNTYPVSRRTDYRYPDNFQGGSVSCFHYQHPVPYDEVTNSFDMRAAELQKADKGLKAGFDSHFVSVSVKDRYHAVDPPTNYDYDEIVLKEAAQVLPIAVVHFR